MRHPYLKPARPVATSLILVIITLWTSVAPQARAVIQPPQPSVAIGDARFGINFVSSVDVNAALPPSTVSLRYQQATAAGAKWSRWPMYWNDIERSRGVRDYSAQERAVDLDIANGFQTHAILLLTPSWSATAGNPDAPFPKVGERSFKPLVTLNGVQLSSVTSPPSGLNLPWNDSNNTWGQFVFATVSKFKDRVKVWEMWNEPDFSFFWLGSAAEYYRLLKVGYQAAKAADSQATVLFAGLSFWSNQNFFPAVLDLAAADPEARGSGFFFDVLPWHPYSDPYYVYEWTQRARSQMQQKLGIVKPVWINETNITVCGEWATTCSQDAVWRATLDEQASYVIQAYAYAIAASVPKMSVFQLWDDGLTVDLDYYGLFTNAAVARPSYKAYQVAATYLSQPSRITRSPGAGYEMVVLEGTPQGKVTVVWATQGSDVLVNVPAASSSAQLVDQAGNLSNVVPSGGYYRVTLPRATNNRNSPPRYIVGGKPYLLVEPVFGNLASQVNPLPAWASDRSFTVSWARQDNSGVPAVFDVQYRVGSSPDWLDWQVGAYQTSTVFGPSSPLAVQDGETYYFRSRLRDSYGGVEAWPAGDGDARTTAPFFFTGKVTDNRDATFIGAAVSAGAYGITTLTGNYSLAVPPGSYALTAAVNGYGTIPPRSLSVGPSSSHNFVLPPLYNYVQNWGFEGGVGANNWWPTSGTVTASSWAHSGTLSAKLGENGSVGYASISQGNVNLPAGIYKPTVSFLYAALPSPVPTGSDAFFLDVTSSAGTVTYPIPLETQGTWAHKWFDLGDVSGPITLNFYLQKASTNQLRVFLDEVSVGKASGGPTKMYFPIIRQR